MFKMWGKGCRNQPNGPSYYKKKLKGPTYYTKIT